MLRTLVRTVIVVALVAVVAIAIFLSRPSRLDTDWSTRLVRRELRERLPLAEPWTKSGLSMTERLELIAGDTRYYAHSVGRSRLMSSMPVVGGTFDARFELGRALLKEGDTEEAIRVFEELVAELGEGGSPERYEQLRLQLAIAYLRLGEQENCIFNHNLDACLLPIRGAGVHQLERGSRGAQRLLTEILSENPDDASARWLLNIVAMTLGEYPDGLPPGSLIPPESFASSVEFDRFFDAATGTGTTGLGLAGGSIVDDLDGDGYLDLMASSLGVRDALELYRNNRDGTFSEVTEEAGLSGQWGGLNIVHADYDNDGDPDVLVLRGAWLGDKGHHPNSLLRNNGDGTFTDVTEEAGLLAFRPTQTASWADYDNDGWLDLFIGNESKARGAGRHPSVLYRNNGDGTFSDVSQEVGIVVDGFVKGAAWGDYDNDGLSDLFVSIRYGQNLLYRNLGPDGEDGWAFADVTAEAGVSEPDYSFPAWWWDYDNDGWLDLFVASYDRSFFGAALNDVVRDYLGQEHSAAGYPRLYRNRGDGTFADMTAEAGLERVMFVMGANFGDLENDGHLDAYLGTGGPPYELLVPNVMFSSDGAGRFHDVTTAGGFGHLQKGHGISFADIDNDGDQDVYAVMGGFLPGDRFANVLFENPGHGNHWITLRLEGVQSNRSGVGARIRLVLAVPDGVREVHAVVSTGGSFGANSLQQEIGLGQAELIETLEVHWPASGETQTFENVAVDQILKVREGSDELEPVALDRFTLAAADAHAGEHAGHHPQ